MSTRRLNMLLVAALLIALCVLPATVFGQSTNGSISGKVIDFEGAALPGVTLSARHQPTGTAYHSMSDAQGRFRMINVRTGGPYSVTAELSGFTPWTIDNESVRLGEDTYLNVQMQLETVSDVIEVTAANPLINPNNMGLSSNVSQEMVENLPNIARGIEDIARTNPYFSITSQDAGAGALTVAGRGNRYNNISIDGSVNNDTFGLAASGVPGGQAETQPISLDAVQEMQLLVAPYDVRQGGFSGGGVNLVTKNGTNNWSATGYYFTRDDSFVGDRDDEDGDDVPFGTFEEDNFGASLGGPIIQDKLFFFTNLDLGERTRPTGFSIGGSGVSINAVNGANEFRDIAQNTYGYDPGGLGEFSRTTDSDKFFVRFDMNVNDSNQVTLRHNFIDATNQILRPSTFDYEFPGHLYNFQSETNSTVFQWNSVWGNNSFNEARINFQTVEDQRAGPTRFPYVQVENVDLDSGNGDVDFEAGTERFSTANALDQDNIEIHDDFTILRGDHSITIGTHNEFFSFDNLFIRENFGAYRFRSLEDFERGWAYRYDYSFSATSDPKQSAKFDVQQLGVYVGDQWTVRPNVTVNYGIRVDAPFYPDTPTRNTEIESFGHRTDQLPDGNAIISPRVGFNWDIGSDGDDQLRGGIGIFAGRMPYVWFSNQYSNTGIEFTRISAFLGGDIDEDNHIDFISDPDNQPETLTGIQTSTNEVDMIDPDFDLPSVLRASLGYDRELGWMGLVGSVELLWSQTQNDIVYQNLNVVPSGETAFDGRALFTTANPDFRDVIFLKNTSEGEQFNAVLKVEKPFSDNWSAHVSYNYGEAESVNDGTSSQARSNWRFLPSVDPNNPEVANSNFLVEHRFNASLSYTHEWGGGWDTNVSLFYNHQAGRPYSNTYRRDENGDFQDNDLLYVPASADEVVVTGGTWEDLDAYIEADDGLRAARGSIVKRNTSFAPWRTTLDLHIGQTIPISMVNAQITFDIENLANLIDSGSGEIRYVGFNETSPVDLTGFDDSGRPIYDLRFDEPGDQFTTDDLRSRWRAKLGLRLRF